MTANELTVQMGDAQHRVVVEPLDEGRFRVLLDGAEHVIDARQIEAGTWSMLVRGRAVLIDIDPGKEGELRVAVGGRQAVLAVLDPRQERLAKAQAAARLARPVAGPEDVCAPMPGKVVSLLVKIGDVVAAGQGVAVIEAMKMENELRAPRGGRVVNVHTSEGQAIEGSKPVVTLE